MFQTYRGDEVNREAYTRSNYLFKYFVQNYRSCCDDEKYCYTKDNRQTEHPSNITAQNRYRSMLDQGMIITNVIPGHTAHLIDLFIDHHINVNPVHIYHHIDDTDHVHFLETRRSKNTLAKRSNITCTKATNQKH